MTRFTHLRMYDSSLRPIGFLPDHSALSVQNVFNDCGTITFDYPATGTNANLLVNADTAFIEVVENGQSSPEWFLLEDDGDTLGPQLDGSPIKVSARSLLAMLEWAVVYPELHQPGGPVNLLYPQNRFVNQTPGAIMYTLFQRARARGALQYMSIDFTATHDSAGQPWPQTYSQQYDSGIDYLTVIKGMSDNFWADIRTAGFTLQMFAPDTVLGEDLPNVIMRKGQNVLEAPIRKRSRRNVRTTILGVGADRVLAEASDAVATQKWGRREGSANDGRAISYGTMVFCTQAALAEVKNEAEGFTIRAAIEEPAGETWALPGRDFGVGHRIRYDQRRLDPATLEPLRVRSITYGWDNSTSDKTCTLELNDRFTEYALKLKGRVDSLLNGISMAPISSTPLAPLPSPTPPAYPANVIALMDLTDGPGGLKLNAATVSWPSVDVKADGLPYNDQAYYLLSYKQGTTQDNTGNWSAEQQVTGTSATIGGLTPAKPYVFRVRAVDQSGNQGAYTYSQIVTGSASAGPPVAPSTPTVTTTPAGGLRVAWDGKAFNGGPMDIDIQSIEVQVATNSNGPWTTFDTLPPGGPGVAVYNVNGDYTSLFYFRFLAFNLGATQTPSAASAGTQGVGLAASDVGKKVLGFDNFQFTDVGNLIGDGSFETAAGRARITLATNASFINAGNQAFNGSWLLRSAPQSATIVLAAASCNAGDEFLVRRAIRGNSGANGTNRILVRWYDVNGALLTQTVALTAPTSDGTWYQQATSPGAVVAPTNAISLDISIDTDGTFTTGTWDNDALELRLKVGTALIRNAAITTALIGDAQITSAKIASLTADKIVAGKMSADLGLAGRLLIGVLNADGTLANPTGQRLEITSNGITQYDSTNTVKVSIGPSGSTFSGQIVGASFQTALSGERIEMNTAQAGVRQINMPSGQTEVSPAQILGVGSYTLRVSSPQTVTGATSAYMDLQAAANTSSASALNMYADHTQQYTATGGDFRGSSQGAQWSFYVGGGLVYYIDLSGPHLASSVNTKTNIASIAPHPDLLDSIDLVAYDRLGKRQTGLLADALWRYPATEEFVAVKDGEPVAVAYERLALHAAIAVRDELRALRAELNLPAKARGDLRELVIH